MSHPPMNVRANWYSVSENIRKYGDVMTWKDIKSTIIIFGESSAEKIYHFCRHARRVVYNNNNYIVLPQDKNNNNKKKSFLLCLGYTRDLCKRINIFLITILGTRIYYHLNNIFVVEIIIYFGRENIVPTALIVTSYWEP